MDGKIHCTHDGTVDNARGKALGKASDAEHVMKKGRGQN
jgi:hypothetical protein